jgi:hypothetical protein
MSERILIRSSWKERVMRAEDSRCFVAFLTQAGTRRAALTAFIGAALMSTALGTDAARVAFERTGKAGSKRKRHGKNGKRKTRGVSGQAGSENHCIAPDGADLNVIYGVSAQIVTGFCSQVELGERWVAPGAPWSMNDTFKLVPRDFVPAGATPLDDFRAKFQGVKFVIDPGTAQEKTVVFSNTDDLFIGSGSQFPGTPENWDVVSPVTMGTLSPLPAGPHVVDVYWLFSAMHCDGLGKKITSNCLTAGEYPYNIGRTFEVMANNA